MSLRPARVARRGVISAPVARTAAVVDTPAGSHTASTSARIGARTVATVGKTAATGLDPHRTGPETDERVLTR